MPQPVPLSDSQYLIHHNVQEKIFLLCDLVLHAICIQ